ncbi:MAG: glycosyltransferase family 4 protein [Gammaproteobacteria bacterium]|nr:glycosyltransferase family 4 protein [Gammaproteobacteria bacterium]
MPGRIAVLVKRFPKLSETFIAGEIDSLLDQGLDVVIISLGRPTETKVHEQSTRLLPRVRYLPDYSLVDAVRVLGRLAVRHPLRMMSVLASGLRDGAGFTQLAALLEICERGNIDYIHAHYISEPSLLAELAMKVRAGKYSISAHAKDIYTTPTPALRRRIQTCEFVSTCTGYNVDHLRALAPEHAQRIELVYHGIDCSKFHPADACHGTATPRVLAIGRFKRKKGFDLLIEACANLANSGTPVSCEIIGYGDQKDALAALIADYGVGGHVTLADPIEHRELIIKLRHASLFVMPCRIPADGDRDGIPNALLEAMACGLPVITTAVSGIPEVIIDGENGLLVAPDDAAGLTAAMGKILCDDTLARKLGQAARATVKQRFSWEANIVALCAMMRGVLSTSQTLETRI